MRAIKVRIVNWAKDVSGKQIRLLNIIETSHNRLSPK